MDIQTLLYHYIEGNASAEEKRRVICWLEEDEAHVREYRTLRKLHDLTIWNEPKQPIHQAEKKSRTINLHKWSRELLKIASVLLVGVFITYFVLRQNENKPQMQTIYVPHGQRVELFLSDGTEVWLNSGTTLTFPDRFTRTTRDITLDGEGYFKVTKDGKRPFIVHTNHYNTRVLGTEFNVKSYTKNNYFEVALLEGSVEVFADNLQAVRLKENEKIYWTDQKLYKEQLTDFNYFKWREGLLCFEKENLASLFTKLELYYDVRIIVKNESLLNWSYSGKFRIRDGVEHVLRVLQRRHQFEYIKNDDENIIIIE